MTATQQRGEELVERIIQFHGQDGFTTQVPKEWDDADVEGFTADIEGMVDAFKDHVAKGKTGAKHYFGIVTRFDPNNSMGHTLYYQPTIKDAKQFVRAAAGVTEAAISRHFSELREGLDSSHPWYLDPNRVEGSTSGGPAKNTPKTSAAEQVVRNIEDPDAFTVETLVSACKVRLAGLDPAGLTNAVAFLTELDELTDARDQAVALVNGFIRQQAQAS